MWYKNNSINNSAKVFVGITATINLIAMACFFETICCGIFEYLLIASFKDKGLFDLMSTYFSIVKTNN